MFIRSGYPLDRRRSLGLIILVAMFQFAKPEAQDTQQHFSAQADGTVRIEFSAASFRVPQDWALYSERPELEKVRNGKGEWRTEYTKILNAALPFSNCSVQAAKWAWIVSTFSGVTVRGYVLDGNSAEINAKIATKALRTAKALPSSTVRNASITKGKADQWNRILTSYDVWYADYGGRANVDSYTTEQNGKTIALVFMYVDMDNNVATVEQILKSFTW